MHMRVLNRTLPENERSEAYGLTQRSRDAEVRRSGRGGDPFRPSFVTAP